MTSTALIRELATKPEFRILSELGQMIAEKVRSANIQKLIEKIEEIPTIEPELEKFRQELADLGIISVEGTLVASLSDDDLYQKVVFPVSIYFIEKIPKG